MFIDEQYHWRCNYYLSDHTDVEEVPQNRNSWEFNDLQDVLQLTNLQTAMADYPKITTHTSINVDEDAKDFSFIY